MTADASRQSETQSEPLTTDSPQPRIFPEPSAELIADIRRRLSELPRNIAQYIDEGLRREPIERVANFLWRAGHGIFMLSELYEYRRTLFPPNAMVDPYTVDAPVLRNPPEPGLAEPLADRSADSLSASDLPTREESSEVSNVKCEIPVPALPTDAPHVTNLTDLTPVTDAPASSAPSDCADPSINPQPSTLNTPGNALLSDLRSVLNCYVVLPEMAAEALALWIVHTYAFTLRPVTTYIGVVSPEKRCGKTTLLELLGLLANRALTASNISPSALFRVIERTQPTLLIDEADTFLQGRDELAGILNAGYRKNNSYVVRIADRKARKKDEHAPEPEFAQWTPDLRHPSSDPCAPTSDFARYSCWCPKVMAAIGRLPDTLADRCIVVTMQRKMPGEKVERMRQLNAADFRKRCAEFVREHSDKIAHAQPEIPSTLNDRAADIWEPLFAIADLARGEWPELARQAAQKLSAGDDDLTLIAYFLKDLRNLMLIRNAEKMLSREIVSALNPMHDRPWEDLRRGREINEWWLGWQLRQLGIRTKTMRVGDAMAKGYTLADIEGAFRRYVPNAELHLQQPTESLKGEIPNPKSSDGEAQTDAELDRILKQLLASLPKESP